MRILAAVIAITCSVANYAQPADLHDTARSPVLLELFTSEGCSSCPPIDTLVQKLDALQPVPNAQVIVLSEHVDYWNHDGWKDPYSSRQFTDRQAAYVRALGLSEPYTPQIILDGSVMVKGYNTQQLSQAFEKTTGAVQLPVHIVGLSVDDASSPILRVRIEVDGESAPAKADVYLAVALDSAESQVSAGENNGKRLTHVAVVESLKKLGKLDAGKTFGQDCQVKIEKGANPANLRVVAFVQEPGPGKVLGVAMQKSSRNDP